MAKEDNDNSVVKASESGKTAKGDATKGLENLGDMKKMLEESTKVDPKKCQEALKKLAEASQANIQEQKKREKELKAVQVKDEDVAYVTDQFLLKKAAADRLLREHGGDLTKTLKTLLDPAAKTEANIRPSNLY
eukprot:g5475.t1